MTSCIKLRQAHCACALFACIAVLGPQTPAHAQGKWVKTFRLELNDTQVAVVNARFTGFLDYGDFDIPVAGFNGTGAPPPGHHIGWANVRFPRQDIRLRASHYYSTSRRAYVLTISGR